MEVSGQVHAPSLFTLGGTASSTYLKGGWVGRRAGLDAVAKRKISCPFWE